MMGLPKKEMLPCEGINKPLDAATIELFLNHLGDGWHLSDDHTHIEKNFYFKNYYQTIAFVNDIAWMTQIENHHPDLAIAHNHCIVRYTTYAVHGLTENDFICAHKVNNLFHSYSENFHATRK